MVDRAKSRQTAPFFDFDADGWISSTAGLTFEERGFYIQVLAFQWSRGGPLPADLLPIMLGCDPRTARRLTSALVSKHRLSTGPQGVSSDRLDAHLQAKSDETSPEVEAKSGESPAKVAEKSDRSAPKNSMKSTRGRAEKESLRGSKIEGNTTPSPIEDVAAREPAKPARMGGDSWSVTDLYNRLVEAAGDALCPISINLQMVAEPRGWLNQGCDLDADILPAIAALSAKAPARSIRSWSYYARAVSEARARRERGLPAVKVDSAAEPPWVQARNARFAEQKRLVDDLIRKADAKRAARGAMQEASHV